MKSVAVTEIDMDTSPLGTKGFYLDTEIKGRSILEHTLSRLKKATAIDRVCINLIGRNQQRREWVESLAKRLDIKIHSINLPDTVRRKMSRAGRKWALDSWRGGVGGVLWFDECGTPANLLEIARLEHAPTITFIPPGAALVDPELLDQQVENYFLHSNDTSISFTQAPPGLTPIIYNTKVLGQMVTKSTTVHTGLRLDIYESVKDPILSVANKIIDRDIRTCKARFLADTRRGVELFEKLFAALPDPENASALTITKTVNAHPEWSAMNGPRDIEIEITGRNNLTTIDRPNHLTTRQETDMSVGHFEKVIDQLVGYDDVCLTLGGFGEPTLHPEIFTMLKIARDKGIFGLHVATNGINLDENAIAKLVEAETDIVTVSIGAHSPESYLAIKGADYFQKVSENIQQAIEFAPRRRHGVPHIVPEITKLRRVENEIEAFFDDWFVKTAWVVIRGHNNYCGQVDDLSVIHLNLSNRNKCHKLMSKLSVFSNGDVPYCEEDFMGKYPVGNIANDSLDELWKNSKIAELRTMHLSGKFDGFELCPKCLDWDKL